MFKNILILIFFSVVKLNAQQWNQISSGTTGKIDAIHFFDSQNGFFGGGFINLKRTTDGGTTWTTQSTQKVRDFSFYNNLYGYSASSVGNSMAKTTDGGLNWASLTPPTSNSLWGVYTVNNTTAFFIGTGGVLWKTTNSGTSFSTLNNLGTTETLTDIAFTTPTIGIVVGQSSIRRTVNGGSSWSLVYSSSLLTEMCFVDANIGYVVGSGGKVIKTTDGGINWTLLTTNSSAYLQGVNFYDANNGIVVGINGVILITNDGGITWNNQNSGTTSNLYDVRMLSATSAVVVGDGGIVLKNENITLAAESFYVEDKIIIYPNPVENVLKIQSKDNVQEVKIYDLSGKILFEENSFNNWPYFEIDLSGLTAGTYILKMNTSSGDFEKLIVKK